MSETHRLLELLISMAEKLVRMTNLLSNLSRVFDQKEDVSQAIVRDISDVEGLVDGNFEDVAVRIMEVEFLNVNPDYLLDIAKHFDSISDLVERAALLFQHLTGFSEPEIIELLTTATAEITQIMSGLVNCMQLLATDRPEVEKICEVISEREKVIDGVRERFNSSIMQKIETFEHRIWLKDIFSHLDQIADLSRDLTITMRVVASKLEKQRLLNVKKIGKS